MILPVKTETGSYNIYLERDALNKADEYLNLDRKVLIVTDSGVPKIYAETVASKCKEAFIETVAEGEPSKCFEVYKSLLEAAVNNGLTRSDCVVAVGGGVVGDMAGFVAATYMRGIDFYNIPTTVLSQVDSSIGGKVAIDFCSLKNIVGAFYPPKAVIIDPETLKTLPNRQISNGLAEALKMALTFDKELFSIFENENIEDNIDKIIESSLKIKRYVVENDEKEQGLRKTLNFGHTVGHAIESENGMQNFYHGECVALGMLPMVDKSIRGRLIAILKKLNLPTETEINAERIIAVMKHDKKLSGDDITVIYVPQIGEFSMKTMPFSEFSKEIKEIYK